MQIWNRTNRRMICLGMLAFSLWSNLTSQAKAQLLPTPAPIQAAKAWMGIAIDKGPKGVLIKRVIPGTPAEKSGLRSGDEVLAVNQTKVKTPDELIQAVSAMGVGFNVRVDFVRESKPMNLELALEARPDSLELLQKSLLNQRARDFKLKTADGKFLSLKDIEGKGAVTILMFWATWCPACKATLPDVKSFAETHFSKVNTLLISAEESDTVTKYFDAHPPLQTNHWRSLTDPEGTMSADYQIPALPTFIVIDSKGTIVHAKIGGGKYFDEVKDLAGKLIGQTK